MGWDTERKGGGKLGPGTLRSVLEDLGGGVTRCLTLLLPCLPQQHGPCSLEPEAKINPSFFELFLSNVLLCEQFFFVFSLFCFSFCPWEEKSNSYNLSPIMRGGRETQGARTTLSARLAKEDTVFCSEVRHAKPVQRVGEKSISAQGEESV